MFLKITQLESFKIRNNIVLKNVIPELGKKYFTKSPFVNSYYGLANPSLYIYEMCRLVDCQYIEFITIYISKRDSYIQIYLNIFELSPSLNDIYQLKNIDGLNFHLLPNNKKRARLTWICYIQFLYLVKDLCLIIINCIQLGQKKEWKDK